jgi:hypothetical protein
MKKLSLLVLALFGVCILHAQDWSGAIYKTGKKYPGYYVGLTGDTVNGYFIHGTKQQNQLRCDFYRNEMDTATGTTFFPEDISSYKVGDKLYRSIHYSGGLLKKPLRFVVVVKDGGISQFTFYSEDPTTPTEEKTVFYKANDPENPDPIELQQLGLGFAKKMSAFTADYEELSKKVADKEKGYGMLQIDAIIDEYNTWYKTNKK